MSSAAELCKKVKQILIETIISFLADFLLSKPEINENILTVTVYSVKIVISHLQVADANLVRVHYS